MTSRGRILALAALAAASTLVASRAEAQYHQRMIRDRESSERTFSYMLGYAAIDNSYSRDTLARAWSVRLTSPIIGRFVVAEFGLGGLSTKAPDGVRERFLIPEGEVQLQLPAGPFRPYFGLGGGWVAGPQNTGALLEGQRGMATAALGVRTYLAGDKLTLNVEARGRSYANASATDRNGKPNPVSGELTAGFGIRF